MVTVRLPAMLRQDGPDTLVINEQVPSVAVLVEILSRRVPSFREKLDDAVLNFAVNDHLILHDVLKQPLRDGDRVEIVPTISGGCGRMSCPKPPTPSTPQHPEDLEHPEHLDHPVLLSK